MSRLAAVAERSASAFGRRARVERRRRAAVAGLTDASRPLRAPQGRHHRLVGRDRRRSRVPSRPVRPARADPSTTADDCRNCREPAGDGVRLRILKDFAFHVVGHRGGGARARPSARPGRPGARPARRAAGGRSWRRRGEHRPLHAVGTDRSSSCSPAAATAIVDGARGRRRPSTSRSSRTGARRRAPGRTTSASTSTTCPRSRIASPRSWAAPRGSSSARANARTAGSSARSPIRGDRLVYEDAVERRLRPVRLALAVRGLGRAAPPRGRLRAGDRRRHRLHGGGAPAGPGPPGHASTGRRTTSCSTPRRSASRSTRPTTGTGRSTRASARSPAWSSGRACR